MIITDEQVEKALFFIRDSGALAGQLAGAVKEAEARRKATEAMAFLQATGSVGERNARAKTDPLAIKASNDYCEAVAEHEKIKLDIKASELAIEIWRSTNANKRVGMV